MSLTGWISAGMFVLATLPTLANHRLEAWYSMTLEKNYTQGMTRMHSNVAGLSSYYTYVSVPGKLVVITVIVMVIVSHETELVGQHYTVTYWLKHQMHACS